MATLKKGSNGNPLRPYHSNHPEISISISVTIRIHFGYGFSNNRNTRISRGQRSASLFPECAICVDRISVTLRSGYFLKTMEIRIFPQHASTATRDSGHIGISMYVRKVSISVMCKKYAIPGY